MAITLTKQRCLSYTSHLESVIQNDFLFSLIEGDDIKAASDGFNAFQLDFEGVCVEIQLFDQGCETETDLKHFKLYVGGSIVAFKLVLEDEVSQDVFGEDVGLVELVDCVFWDLVVLGIAGDDEVSIGHAFERCFVAYEFFAL